MRDPGAVRPNPAPAGPDGVVGPGDPRFRSLFDVPGVATWEMDVDGHLVAMNDAGRALIGDAAPEGPFPYVSIIAERDRPTVAAAYQRLLSGAEDALTVEFSLVEAAGGRRMVASAGAVRAADGSLSAVVGVSVDLTEQHRARQQIAISRQRAMADLHHAAHHDDLTGLPNRRQLDARLADLGAAPSPLPPTALLMTDVDHFRVLNDALGHAEGDRLLRILTDRIRSALPEQALVARFSGDVFAVLLAVEDLPHAHTIAEEIRTAIAAPVVLGQAPLVVTASIGLSLATTPADVGLLLQRADAALHRAKAQGRNRVATAQRHAAHEAAEQLALEADLRTAVQRGDLAVHYQPQVDLRTGRVVALEALARWTHPTRGPVSPTRFIALAERTDLILELGDLVLRTAVRDLADVVDHTGAPVGISVNVSARQLVDGGLAAVAEEVLAAHGVTPSRLCLELTESAIASDPTRATATARQLQGMGVRIAIDDFGTGWSSFAQMKQFKADQLKIDRSFVDGLGRDHDDTEIVRAIIGMARALGTTLVAEAVEHATQVAALADLQCDVVQGYHFSAAVPVDRVADVIGRLRGVGLATATIPEAPSSPVGAELALQVLDHEVRNPLSVIMGFADVLRDTAALQGGDRAAVDAIRRASAAIAATLDSLGAATGRRRARGGQGFVEVDVHALVTEVVEEFRPLLDRKRLECEQSDTAAPVMGDPQALRRILFNLLTNANKYAPGDTTIVVGVGCRGGRALVSVCDSGPGVPVAHVDRVFDRHHRATETAKGHGLGLHLARESARHHGGDLMYRPGPDGGAVFVLDLPTTSAALHPEPVAHHVHVGHDGDEMDERVARHLHEGLAAGEGAIIIARPARRQAVADRLAEVIGRAGDAAAPWTLVDAEGLLDRVLVGDRVDLQRARTVIGDLVEQAGAGGRPVRVYDEAVDVLAGRGRVIDAVALERVWEELGQQLGVSLLWGYSSGTRTRADATGGAGQRASLPS